MRFSLLIEELLIPAGVTQGLRELLNYGKGDTACIEKSTIREAQSLKSYRIPHLDRLLGGEEQRSSYRAPLIERPNRPFAVSPHVCTYWVSHKGYPYSIYC